LQFGESTDKLTPGDFTGDSKFDASFFAPLNLMWFMNQTNAGVGIVTFGSASDLQVPNAFVS
jgi:hypothetical protein